MEFSYLAKILDSPNPVFGACVLPPNDPSIPGPFYEVDYFPFCLPGPTVFQFTSGGCVDYSVNESSCQSVVSIIDCVRTTAYDFF